MKKIVIAARGNGKTNMALAELLSKEFEIPYEEAYKIVIESSHVNLTKGK